MSHLLALLDYIEGPPTRELVLLAEEYDATLRRLQESLLRPTSAKDTDG